MVALPPTNADSYTWSKYLITFYFNNLNTRTNNDNVCVSVYICSLLRTIIYLKIVQKCLAYHFHCLKCKSFYQVWMLKHSHLYDSYNTCLYCTVQCSEESSGLSPFNLITQVKVCNVCMWKSTRSKLRLKLSSLATTTLFYKNKRRIRLDPREQWTLAYYLLFRYYQLKCISLSIIFLHTLSVISKAWKYGF